MIELVAVMAILVIVFSIIFSLLESGYKNFNNGKRLSNVESNGRITMETISQDIKTSKLFIDTATIRSMSTFSNPVKFDDGTLVLQANMITYIEDNNDNRYMYALKTVVGKNEQELHKLKFSPQGVQRYKLLENATERLLSPSDINIYSADTQNIVAINPLTNEVDIQKLEKLKSGYLSAKVFYENYGSNAYLWVIAADSTQYFYTLTTVYNTDFDNPQDRVIASYITDLSVENKTELGTINLSVTDGDKSKAINTSVSLLNNKK